MIEKSDDSIRAKKYIKKAAGGGGISASAPRPHGTSEGSNTGKLIPGRMGTRGRERGRQNARGRQGREEEEEKGEDNVGGLSRRL